MRGNWPCTNSGTFALKIKSCYLRVAHYKSGLFIWAVNLPKARTFSNIWELPSASATSGWQTVVA